MNKIAEFHQVGNPEVLSISQQNIPIPKENELVIQIKACGLNRAELLYMQGQYLFTPSFPSKIGMEASGIIYDLGANVNDGFSKGDEVCLTPNIKMNEYGFIGQYVLVPKEAVIVKSPKISFEQAAAMWVPYLTAYGGLVLKGGLEKGKNQTVLISAASSSVGIAAIQMAKNFGAKVIVTTRTQVKKEFLLNQGADEVIVTNEENFVERVNQLTNGKGFDIGFDAIGGSFFNQLAEAAGQGANLIIYGLLSLEETPLPFFPLAIKELSIYGFHAVFNLIQQPEKFHAASQHIQNSIETGIYKLIIDKIFSLEDVSLAYEYMMNGTQKGKILIKID